LVKKNNGVLPSDIGNQEADRFVWGQKGDAVVFIRKARAIADP
jgi:hypothetical protein